jgi:predicted transcriptional regulator
MNEDIEKTWFKKHSDTIAMLAVMLGGFYWIDGKFDKINDRFSSINDRFESIERDMNIIKTEVAVIKTVMIMQNIMPKELAHNDDGQVKKVE